MNRYFINRKNGANKFWSIAVKNRTLIISFGRIATVGREIKKEFVTQATCFSEYNKLIKEKTSKGYKETKQLPVVLIKSTSRFSPINEKSFWKLIDVSTKSTSIQRQAIYLKKELKKLSAKDLAVYQNIFNKLENAAYHWNLWAAAYTIHVGCSDDSFADFRGWLITRGKLVYEKALANSDSLHKLGIKKLEQSGNGEQFLYVADNVYEELYDSDIRDDKHTKSLKAKTRPSGREWKEGDLRALQKLNPSLFALFKSKWRKTLL